MLEKEKKKCIYAIIRFSLCFLAPKREKFTREHEHPPYRLTYFCFSCVHFVYVCMYMCMRACVFVVYLLCSFFFVLCCCIRVISYLFFFHVIILKRQFLHFVRRRDDAFLSHATHYSANQQVLKLSSSTSNEALFKKGNRDDEGVHICIYLHTCEINVPCHFFFFKVAHFILTLSSSYIFFFLFFSLETRRSHTFYTR